MARKSASTAAGLRTKTELRAAIPIGGSCWIIYFNPHTMEPKGIEEFTRKSASVFVSVQTGDEEHMHEHMTIEQILERPYGGAWLQKIDAEKYLALLQKFWKEVPRTLDAQAQLYLKKTEQ
jgi:hypothetical protein